MAILTPVSEFDDVYQLETTDPVLGGAGGMANRQAQQLLNRTKYLQDAIAAIDSSGGPFNLDASAGITPTAGSGPGGAVKRKDLYVVTVAGTISSVVLQQGDELIAKIDNAVLITDYVILQGNAGLATPTVLGLVKLSQDITPGSAADVTISLAGLISLFAKLASPAFTGNPTTTDQTANNNSGRIANTKYVDAAVAVEAGQRNSGINLESIARDTADTGLQNNINAESTTRANADSTEASARAAGIALEAANRISGDNTLLGYINGILSKTWLAVAAFATNFSNSTAGTRKCEYYKDPFNRVWIKGCIASSANIPAASSTLMFTLPAGYRHAATNPISIPIGPLSTSAGNNIFIKIDAGGGVSVLTGTNAILANSPIELGEFGFSVDGVIN